jgi:hypothetical protein
VLATIFNTTRSKITTATGTHSSHVHTTGHLTNTRRSDGEPELDGALREVVRTKILHYRQLYINRPDPIAFLPDTADTTGRVYDDFSRLLFLNAHREASALANEIPEESGQFRFLRAAQFRFYPSSTLYLSETSSSSFRFFPCFNSSTFCLSGT